MNCERFEASLVDELYEELDELTSAAAKRHIAGCARCASLLGGMRATRRVAVLPVVEPSAGLESRILTAARNAQREVPFGRRLSRAVSLAGSWAMRPQTAMAAVFILFVGSSVLFVRRSKVAHSGSVTITAHGQPASESMSASTDAPTEPLDSKVAAAAHGAPNIYSPTLAASNASTGEAALTNKERSALPKGSLDSLALGDEESPGSTRRGAPNTSVNAGPSTPSPAARASASGKDESPTGGWGTATVAGVGVPSSSSAQGSSQSVADGSRSADFSAALQSAITVRQTTGCAAATDTFDRLAQQAWGSQAGYEAMFNAGQCYEELGKKDSALQRFRTLITVPRYAPLAQERINRLSGSQQGQSQLAAARAASAKPAFKTPGVVKASQAAATTSPPPVPAQTAPAAPQQPQQAY